MAKARRSTGCKLVQTFDDGTTVEYDFGDYLEGYSIETTLERDNRRQRGVATIIFHKPWEERQVTNTSMIETEDDYWAFEEYRRRGKKA